MHAKFLLLISLLFACTPQEKEGYRNRRSGAPGTRGHDGSHPVRTEYRRADDAADAALFDEAFAVPNASCETADLDGVLYVRSDRQGETGAYWGTATVLAHDGTSITAYHVIEGATRVKAIPMTHDGDRGKRFETAMDMTVVRISAEHDVALIRPKYPQNLRMALNVNRSLPKWGDGVCHMGISTVKAGGKVTKLHAVSRTPEATVTNAIRASIPVMPGDSGGPLTNERGEVIGVCLSLVMNRDIAYFYPIDRALKALRYSPPQ